MKPVKLDSFLVRFNALPPLFVDFNPQIFKSDHHLVDGTIYQIVTI